VRLTKAGASRAVAAGIFRPSFNKGLDGVAGRCKLRLL
jgi:hypothetical protein